MATEIQNIHSELNTIKKEISEIKLILMQNKKPKKIVSLKGILKGIKFNENEIKKAKKSLFKGV